MGASTAYFKTRLAEFIQASPPRPLADDLSRWAALLQESAECVGLFVQEFVADKLRPYGTADRRFVVF